MGTIKLTKISGSSGEVAVVGDTTITGSLTVTGFVAAASRTSLVATLFANATAIDENTTLPVSYNSVMYGPITINASKTLTISTGSALKIRDISDIW